MNHMIMEMDTDMVMEMGMGTDMSTEKGTGIKNMVMENQILLLVIMHTRTSCIYFHMYILVAPLEHTSSKTLEMMNLTLQNVRQRPLKKAISSYFH